MRHYTVMALSALALLAGCGDFTDTRPQMNSEDVGASKDMLHNSPAPNASPDTPPSEVSASPNGQSLGTSPMP